MNTVLWGRVVPIALLLIISIVAWQRRPALSRSK